MPRKLFITITSALVCLTGMWAQSKISAYTQMFLDSQKGDTEATRMVQKNIVKPQSRNGINYIGALITLKDILKVTELTVQGVEVDNSFGNILTIRIPIDKIEYVSSLENVTRIDVERPLHLNNDSVRMYTKVNEVQAATNLPKSFNGKGVVLGVVDYGIDYNHANFKDINGKTRIVSVYDGDSTFTAEQLPTLTSDCVNESHGTHTSGIAGGSYSDNGFQGMAPGSDLYLCCLGNELTTTRVLNSCKEIFDYATSKAQPAVINLSLGEHDGPHDGSDEFTKCLNQLTGEGRIIVISSGNEGTSKLYIHKKYEKNDTLCTVLESSQVGHYYKNQITMSIIGTDGDEIDVWNSDSRCAFLSKDYKGFEDGSDSYSINSMACGPNTISVGAYVNKSHIKTISGDIIDNYVTAGAMSFFSSYGIDMNGISHPYITAPGHGVTSSVNNYDPTIIRYNYRLQDKRELFGRENYWGDMSGTSMASPAVTGIIALWLEANPKLSSEDINNLFHETATVDTFVTNYSNKIQWGAGKINAYEGLKKILASGVDDPSVAQDRVFVYPNPTDDQINVFAQGETKPITISIYTVDGSLKYTTKSIPDQSALQLNLREYLAPGIYIINVKGEKGNFSDRLIIK